MGLAEEVEEFLRTWITSVAQDESAPEITERPMRRFTPGNPRKGTVGQWVRHCEHCYHAQYAAQGEPLNTHLHLCKRNGRMCRVYWPEA